MNSRLDRVHWGRILLYLVKVKKKQLVRSACKYTVYNFMWAVDGKALTRLIANDGLLGTRRRTRVRGFISNFIIR